MMGHEIRVPIDLVFGKPEPECYNEGITKYGTKLAENIEQAHEFGREVLKTSSMRMKRQYDVDAKIRRFKVGESVWLYSVVCKKGLSPKLTRPWTGPYVIIKRINDLVYKIRLTTKAKPKIVHRNRLWKYNGRLERTGNTALRRGERVRREPEYTP
jgi:hypothetical protein